jgi:hypothetical protein
MILGQGENDENHGIKIRWRETPKIFAFFCIFCLQCRSHSAKTAILQKGTMNRTMKTILAILAGGLLLCQHTQAQAITGGIEFFGSSTASGASGMGLTTTISFSNPWHSLATTGSYNGVLTGTDTTFNGFSFMNDGTAATLIGNDSPIWTFNFGGNAYSFDLHTLTSGHVEPGAMAFSGTGIAHITGFDDTPASFALQGAGSGFDFTLSSSTTAAVPEGSTTVLLVLGLLLVGIVTFRQKLRA